MLGLVLVLVLLPLLLGFTLLPLLDLVLVLVLLDLVLLAGLGLRLFSANCLALRLACKAVLALLRLLLYSAFGMNFIVLVPGTVVEYPPNIPFLSVASSLYTSRSLFRLLLRALRDTFTKDLPLANAFT